jgi:hypothetical protein
LIKYLSQAIVTACGNSKEIAKHDVEWYLAHEKELAETLKECMNNPGELIDTPDCINAEQASFKKMAKPVPYTASGKEW